MTTRKADFRTTVLVMALVLGIGLKTASGQATRPAQAPAGRENRTGSPEKSGASNAMMQPLTNMLSQFKSVKRTGDPDRDYAMLIRIHEQVEADLLQQGMKASKNTALVNTIQGLVAQKEKEVSELRKISLQLRGGSPNQAFSQQIDQKLLAMELDLKNGMNGRLTDDPEKDFLAILTQHQQDSIDLTESYLPFAKDKALKSYAQQLLDNRRKELEKMKAMMKS